MREFPEEHNVLFNTGFIVQVEMRPAGQGESLVHGNNVQKVLL